MCLFNSGYLGKCGVFRSGVLTIKYETLSYIVVFKCLSLPLPFSLPLSLSQYLQLARVPLEMMQECMRLQLELRKAKKPSVFSIRPVSVIEQCTIIDWIVVYMCTQFILLL